MCCCRRALAEMPLCAGDGGCQGRQTCQAQLGRELTNVMMASPRSLQVPPLVCCGRAVPLCCSWCRRVTERSRWMWSQQQQQMRPRMSASQQHENIPAMVESIFTTLHPNWDLFFEKRSGLTRRVWSWSGENTIAKRGCAQVTSTVVGREEGETLDVAKKGGLAPRARRWPASYLSGQNFNIGVEESFRFSVPK